MVSILLMTPLALRGSFLVGAAWIVAMMLFGDPKADDNARVDDDAGIVAWNSCDMVCSNSFACLGKRAFFSESVP